MCDVEAERVSRLRQLRRVDDGFSSTIISVEG
jgi:hypothetical protein